MKSSARGRWLFALLPWLCFALCCLAVGFTLYKNYDFSAINGDYQNYNTVRRMWAGQVPFRDFTAYLGAGVSWLMWLVTLPFGNTLMDSKMAMRMLSFAVCCLSVGAWVRWETGSRRAARWTLGLFAGFAALSGVLRVTPLLRELGIGELLLQSSSMRQARVLIPVLLGLTLTALCRLPEPRRKLPLRPYAAPLALGCLAGFARVWSNDGGLSAVVAMLLGFFILRVRRDKRFWLELLALVVSYALFQFLWATLLTGGHYASWFQYNSLVGDCAGEQRWRFRYGSEKAYALVDILRVLAAQPLSVWALLLYATWRLLRARALPGLRAQVGAYSLATLSYTLVFCQVLNQLGTATVFAHCQPLIDLGALTLAAVWLARGVAALLRARGARPAWTGRFAAWMAGVLAVGMSVTACAQVATTYQTAQYTGMQYRRASGYATQLAGKTVFSTYASALEDWSGTFQPSGTDYIIHVMGDDMRAEYLRTFRELAPDVVCTQNPAKSDWEPWILRANWYFYRELLANYTPLASEDGYLFLWQRADATQATPVPESSVFECDGGTLTVRTEPGEPRVMDVQLRYSVTARNGLSRLLYVGSQAEVRDAWSNDRQEVSVFPLPGGAERTALVPVYIDETGVGTLQVTLYPAGLTALTLHSAEGLSLLPLPEAYRP